MAVSRFFKKLFLQKAFPVELPEKYTHPNWPGFEMPTEDVFITSIMKYAQGGGESVEFLSVGKPLIFCLNGRDFYEAELRMGRTRMRSGYYLYCRQIIE